RATDDIMITSWNWLKEYVSLETPVDEVASRLTMSGLNLETIEPVAADFAIDLEVTSNRPDCLGHIGVAREAAVLFDQTVNTPNSQPSPAQTSKTRTDSVTSVTIEAPDLCPVYIARVIQGVKVAPSPAWMQERLRTIGIEPINNLVDITNYVLMECGQPLHAFDFDRLSGGKIIVRRARKGEKIHAIDHSEYELTESMCVIADAERPVAVAGVMGGAETEISDETTNVLIEVAQFAPGSIRSTARTIRTAEGAKRRIGLQSDSSYRFERGTDSQQLHWASDRCCQLILELAGGTLLAEPVVAGKIPEWTPEPVTLRVSRLAKLLGIEIPTDTIRTILTALGLTEVTSSQVSQGTTIETLQFLPPSWRRDLTREVDLIEEVARIHGYHHIPEDRPIPIVAGKRSPRERVTERLHHVMTAHGFHEALTFSFTPDDLIELFDPAPHIEAVAVAPAAGEYGSRLRKSLIPSLVAARRDNERKGNLDARLYEISRVFIAPNPDDPTTQPVQVGMVTGQSFAEVRGILDALLNAVGSTATVSVKPVELAAFVTGRGAEILLNGERWALFGELDREAPPLKRFKLRDPLTIAEIGLLPLVDVARLITTANAVNPHQSVTRELNFLLDDDVTWQQLEETIRNAAGSLLQQVQFVEQYRGKQIPQGKKSYFTSLLYQAPDRTLTGDEVEACQLAVLTACRQNLAAELRG
ncbi:MAG: phenylalanine--tRNA ligase subunit beta, partial [Planctomycetaceae bacterium]